jgi:hypothetical protein
MINPENKCAKLWNAVSSEQITEKLGNQSISDTVSKMLKMQSDLQLHVAKAKPDAGNKAPSECGIVEGSQFAMYYFGCATTEFFELMERYDNYNTQPDNLDYYETIYEYIDIWHFLMNVFLYSGVEPDYCNIQNNYFAPDNSQYCLEQQVLQRWAKVTLYVGELIGLLPFKKWKTYSGTLHVDYDALYVVANKLTTQFFLLGADLGITELDFKRLYLSKNIENFDRQDRGY